MINRPNLFIQFRKSLYSCFRQRADALFDLLDALLECDQVESPVAVSQQSSFRRRYSSVYDGLSAGRLDEAAAQKLLVESVPGTVQTISDYEVHVVDATSVYRPEAVTLSDRVLLKSDQRETAQPGQAYSLLARAIQVGSSWVAPEAVQRISSAQTASQVAGEQVRDLAQQNTQRKVIVGDSGYANTVFLAVFVLLQHVVALVRLRSNQVLYAAPPAYSGRGRPRKHGARFKVSKPGWAADQVCTIELLGQSVTLSAWYRLHFKKLTTLPGLVLCGLSPPRRYTALQETVAPVLDRPTGHSAGRHLSDVSVAFRHRTLLPLSETASRSHIGAPDGRRRHPIVGLAMRPGLHPACPCCAVCSRHCPTLAAS